MNREIGSKAIVTKAGSHEFEIGEVVVFDGICDDILDSPYVKFTNLDGSDYWYLEKHEFEYIDMSVSKDFNLEGSLKDILDGQLVILRNGPPAKITQDLREFVNDLECKYPLVGYIVTEKEVIVMNWTLNGLCNSPSEDYDIIGLDCSLEYPENMWNIIDPKWIYAAVDEDGESWFFTERPTKSIHHSIGYWEPDGNGDCAQNNIIPVTALNWETSLTKRV